ncbi:MAG: formyltetrahydrofolate deformylase [SAR324 cluster bacterium]|nr:formyltetrahydrofolate deformylase [SAR324 cluster bacterium]
MLADTTARLLITCPDCPGIVAAVSNFLYNHGANITDLDQHSTDPEGGTFFMRLEFQTPNLDVSRAVFAQTFAQAVARRYNMEWRISYASDLKKIVLFVSKYDHALLEILWRWSRKELFAEIMMVISNHTDLKEITESFRVPFFHIPVNAQNKQEAESRVLELIQGKADLIILARYMQILTEHLVSHYPNQIINIHHSFLPAFKGANPYLQAAEKGVKLIGATAHYVTVDLDMGPIIEQDVIRVSHSHPSEELKALGKDIERSVLARAVKWHLEDRILVHQNKTIVFA